MFAAQAVEKIFAQGYGYKKAGVVVMDLVPENEVQLSLFENSNPRHKPLMKAVDELNSKFGKQKVRLGIQDPNRIWKMRQEKLSPCYTTNISDIITIKV